MKTVYVEGTGPIEDVTDRNQWSGSMWVDWLDYRSGESKYKPEWISYYEHYKEEEEKALEQLEEKNAEAVNILRDPELYRAWRNSPEGQRVLFNKRDPLTEAEQRAVPVSQHPQVQADTKDYPSYLRWRESEQGILALKLHINGEKAAYFAQRLKMLRDARYEAEKATAQVTGE